MNGSELYQYILDNTLHDLKGTWEVTQNNELKVTGSNVNGSYVVFPDILTNFSIEWDMAILSSGGYINSGISPIILSSYQGSNLEGWNNGSTITNAKFYYFLCNHRNTTNFGSIFVCNNGTTQGSWIDSNYQNTFNVGTKYRYKLERKNGLFNLYQDNTLVSSFVDPTNNIPIYIGWYIWYGGTYTDYQANFIVDNYVITDLNADTINYVDKFGVAEIWANTKNYIASQLLGKSNVGHTHSASDITSGLATVATSGSYNDLSNKPTLESLGASSIPFHNAYPRCKYLGTSITDAQNTAIKNRTYDDLFIGDYWTINGVNWRIVAIDYYYNVGDTNFNKGNIIVMPDSVLYNAQMNTSNTTAGAYHGSLMRTQNLNNARTIVRNAFGSHLANHRIVLANSVDASGPNNWSWYDSDGVELPNEVQIYGTRVWGSALKGFDVATQKQQFPLLALAPQFVNIRQTYWLQDVSSYSVSSYFARVVYVGFADGNVASDSIGVRPSVTLSYI